MIWLAIDKNGLECIYDSKPFKEENESLWHSYGNYMEIPKGTIDKILGKELTWEDEPIKLK